MQAILLDEHEIQALIERRRRTGADRHDEVWDGVYLMAPLASNEHQRIVGELTRVFLEIAPLEALVLPGANVSARDAGWEHDYRCPDVVVVLSGGAARDAGTHLIGGPDLVVEIVSPNDRSRDKLGFYQSAGVREVLFIDRDTKALELNVLRAGVLEPASASSGELEISTLGLLLSVEPADASISIRHAASQRTWRL